MQVSEERMAAARSLTWESECRPQIRFLDEAGDVGFLALWNLLDQYVMPRLRETEQPRLAMAGNLRTPLGISFLLRGLYLHPHLTTLVVWGQDYTKTGDAVLALWAEGLTDDGQIPRFGWKLDGQIDRAAVDELRRTTRLIDGRKRSIAEAIALIDGQEPLPRRASVREFPPIEIPLLPTLPSRGTSITDTARDPQEAWLKVLNVIMKYGAIRRTRKKETIRHFFHVSVTLPVPAEESIGSAFDFSAADLDTYYAGFISAAPPDPGVDYRYGNRLQDWRGHNQLREVIDRLKASPDTKRATIALLDAADLATLEDAPCYISATFAIDGDRLLSSHVFRSHDIYEGWPSNVFSILRLHRTVAAELGLQMGTATITSLNAQVYERHWASAAAKLADWEMSLSRYRTNYLFDPDPCGNVHFSIDPETRDITARLTNPAGDELLWEIRHRDPFNLVHRIVELMPGLDDHHKIYLGSEARKLVHSLKTGEPYVQD